jgi:hypothetical protein
MLNQRITPAVVIERLLRLPQNQADRAWIEELLWFLEFQESRPEGLREIADGLIDEYPELLGPDSFACACGKKKLSRAEAKAFWQTVPFRFHDAFSEIMPAAFVREREELLRPESEDCRFEASRSERENGVAELETDKLRSIIRGVARDEIETCLTRFVLQPVEADCGWSVELMSCPAPSRSLVGDRKLECWSFRNLVPVLKAFMETRADKVRARIAETSVVRAVFEALDFAWSEGAMIQIQGDPRFGKTEAIATYCEMYPGRARLVTVPCESTDADFFIAIAETLRIPMEGPNCNVGDLRRRVDHVLKNSRLMLIFDEAHFLLPQSYSDTTPPKRMNWVRTRVADRGLPAALMITPQSFDGAFKKYVRKTQYRFDQFLGRTAPFTLPSKLTKEDVLAVGQIHFPEIPLPFLKLIAGRAMLSPGYLQSFEFTAKRARCLARKAGRTAPIEGDVMKAMEEMMPCKSVAMAEKPPREGIAKPREEDAETGSEVISRIERTDPITASRAAVLAA